MFDDFWVVLGGVLGVFLGANTHEKTYLYSALFLKPFFKDFRSILVGFWVPKW